MGNGNQSHITWLRRRTWGPWIRAGVYLFSGVAFATDLSQDIGIAFGVFYIPLVATAVLHRAPVAIWWLAALAIAFVFAGFLVPHVNAEIDTNLVDLALSVAVILVTAFLTQRERMIRDQLVAQTARADAADRAKTQLFNNLSHELRTPLTAILGFADLLMVKARPDQREPLGHIQIGGRRLLSTLDNLIDLTQIRDRPVRSRSVDLVPILAQSVEANRPLAQDKRIALTLARMEGGFPRVLADGWALRRIMDNLIANGIKFTEPGGSVEIALRPEDDGTLVTVRDTGAGMPPDVLRQIGSPFYQADTGTSRRFEGMGAGLALSLRLAKAMGAGLHFDSTPGIGTTAALVLPGAADQASR
jgi:signal transduction histidine kinase